VWSEARPDPGGDTYHGIVRYRAVTEPARLRRFSVTTGGG
jgi:hypothetical protein